MGKGLSDLQRRILELLGSGGPRSAMTPAEVSHYLERHVPRTPRRGQYMEMTQAHKLTASQRVTIHRSLRSLVARGLAEVDARHCYRLTDVGITIADGLFPGLADQRALRNAAWQEALEAMARAFARR